MMKKYESGSEVERRKSICVGSLSLGPNLPEGEVWRKLWKGFMYWEYPENRMQLKNKIMKKFCPSSAATSRRRSHSHLVVSGRQTSSNTQIYFLFSKSKKKKNLFFIDIKHWVAHSDQDEEERLARVGGAGEGRRYSGMRRSLLLLLLDYY